MGSKLSELNEQWFFFLDSNTIIKMKKQQFEEDDEDEEEEEDEDEEEEEKDQDEKKDAEISIINLIDYNPQPVENILNDKRFNEFTKIFVN